MKLWQSRLLAEIASKNNDIIISKRIQVQKNAIY